MFGHGPYYFSTIRKMVIYFGNVFNDLHITRSDAEGNVVQLLKVPLTYAPKNKMLLRIAADPEIQRQDAITLPRMSFELTSMKYDGDRKLHTSGKVAVKDNSDANKLKRQYNPVPYNFEFALHIYVKNAEDGTKIIEQILPFFTPEWTATVNLIPEMNISMDIPIVMNSINIEDNYDTGFLERRALVWTLAFTVKGYLYGPIVSKPIIKLSKMEFFVPSGVGNIPQSEVGNTNMIELITVKPGMLANGSPTSNSILSVNTSSIFIDDDFGYCVDSTGILLEESTQVNDNQQPSADSNRFRADNDYLTVDTE